jgi:hypothetical protein
MAGERILFPEFRDEQGGSRYPFADTATLTDTTGEISIAANAFIDASFFGIGLTARVYLSHVLVTPQRVTLYVGTEAEPTKLVSTYDPVSGVQNNTLAFFDEYDRPSGMLLIDPIHLSKFNAWLPGEYTFTQDATEFVSTVVVPSPALGVRGIVFEDNFIYGDVWLVGNAGVVIRQENTDSNVIRVDVVGEPLFSRFVCEPLGDFPAKPYLKTINGCGPEAFGNFTITATNKNVHDPVLRISPQNNALIVSVVGRSPV